MLAACPPGLPASRRLMRMVSGRVFDVAVCRAVAAAVLNDPMAVNFVSTTGQTRFSALASGEVDMLARNTTWTFSRDVDLGNTFAGVNYYDGQGFMVNRELGVSSAMELDGATVCIQTGTTTELNLADFFRVNGMSYEPVPIETNAEAQQQYLAGACDVYTTDASGLAATRASFPEPGNHAILPEIISKEPLGPAVRQGDEQWADIVRWVLNALIAAEELGVTSANIEELKAGTDNPEINRMLGSEGELGAMLGLDAEWAVRAIAAGGNYGEIFASTIGEQNSDRSGTRSERSMDPRWPALRTALPLSSGTGTAPPRSGRGFFSFLFYPLSAFGQTLPPSSDRRVLCRAPAIFARRQRRRKRPSGLACCCTTSATGRLQFRSCSCLS